MAKSRKRGGQKAHNKRIAARTERIKRDQAWAEDFMKNYQVNQEMVDKVKQHRDVMQMPNISGPQTIMLPGGDQ